MRYLMTVGMISAVKRMQREAVAWEEKRPSTEKTVMAVSLRSKGRRRDKHQLLWTTLMNRSLSEDISC